MSNLYNSYANFKTEINLLSFRDSNIFASDPNVLRISFSTSFPFGVVALSAVVVTACLNCSQTVFVANTYYTVCITSDIICCARSCWWPLLGHIVFSSTCNNISEAADQKVLQKVLFLLPPQYSLTWSLTGVSPALKWNIHLWLARIRTAGSIFFQICWCEPLL